MYYDWYEVEIVAWFNLIPTPEFERIEREVAELAREEARGHEDIFGCPQCRVDNNETFYASEEDYEHTYGKLRVYVRTSDRSTTIERIRSYLLSNGAYKAVAETIDVGDYDKHNSTVIYY